MARSLRAVSALVIFSFVSIICHAQLGPVDGATATPIPGAGHNYLQDLVDTVNPADGSVSVRIATPTPAGRGLTVPFTFNYDSNGVWQPIYVANGTMGTASNSHFLSSGGWSYGIPRMDMVLVMLQTEQENRQIFCPIYTSYAFSDSSGTRHSIGAAATTDSASPCQTLDGRTENNYGDDVIQEYQTPNLGPLYLADPSGTVYKLAVGGCLTNGGYSSLPSSIEDRNGNLVTISQNCDGVFTVQDTLGRTQISSSGFGTSGNTVTISGLQQPYTLTWGSATGSMQVPYKLVDSSQSGCNAFAGAALGGTASVVSGVELPNGQSFSFGFDPSYGLLDEIVYPSGAKVLYAWGINPLSAYFQYPSEGVDGEQGPPCEYEYGTFAIAHRYLYNTSGTMILEQDFTYSPTMWNSAGTAWTSKGTTVTTTDKVSGVVSKTSYTYTPYNMGLPPYVVNMPEPQVALENTIVYQDGSGNTLKSVTKSWNDPFELKTEQVALPGGANGTETSETAYSYGAGAQVTQKSEYDFGTSGPGNLLRKTVTNYQTFNDTAIFTSAPSIVDRPCQVILYDGGGNRYAETDTYYDNGATGTPCGTAGTPSVSGAGGSSLTGHDETNYSASGTSPRGNATTVVRQCFQGTTSCASGNPTTTFSYDETGQMLSMTDPNANTTSYSYADNFVSTNSTGFSTTAGDPPSGHVTNAYLTKITMPSTSGVAHLEKFAYGYNGGELTESFDQNSQQTTYRYNDSLGRITETDYPDNGKTTLSYNDTAPSPSVTTTNLMTTTQNMTEVAVMDGMGHIGQTQLTSDPEGTVYTATLYDGLGRRLHVSNPYRSTSEATDGTTAFSYDTLSRVTQVGEQDGSQIITTYSGNCTTVTDEVGNARESCVDGLGRVNSVVEDPGSAPHLNYLTTYSYDPLGDLTGVIQNGSSSANARVRTFMYDSLSRLTSAANPEQMTPPPANEPSVPITYAYDANGNLVTKTAPMPNQWGTATVTTTYSYDALNRLTSKSYSDGTPWARYEYDTPPAWMPTLKYVVGRVANSTNPYGGSVSTEATATAYSYDPMGRVVQEWEQTPSLSPGGAVIYATYDLAGNLTSTTNAANTTLSFGHDGAARITSVTSSLNDANHPATLWSTDPTQGYYAPGFLEKAVFGNGLTESRVYTPRFQACSIILNTSGGIRNGCSGSLPTGIIQNYQYYFGVWGSAVNGNIVGWGASGAQTFNRFYNYDSLNRLQSMTDSVSTQPCQGLSWTIDAWGNMTAQTATAGSCYQFQGEVNNNNQLIGYNYDSAGNMTYDGVHLYTYDAENRVIQVDGGSTATYVYNENGRRVRKSTGSTFTEYFYGPNGLVESEWNGSSWPAQYVYAEEKLVAEYTASTSEFIFADHLGSTRTVTGMSQQVLDSMDYYPYGLQSAGASATTHKFTGKERDTESGLDYFGARHYASTMGRWMVPDKPFDDQAPSDPQSWNLYSYVRNNPLRFTDPNGGACVQGSDGSYHDDNNGGESCAQVDVNNATTGPSVTVSATTDDVSYQLANNIANLTSTSSLSEVGVNGMLWAGSARAAWDLGALGLSWAMGRASGEMIQGLYGPVSRATLEAAASGGGSTVRVVCTLDAAPAAGKALSTATGAGADALANAAGGGAKYVANIPSALVQTMENAGLVTRSTTSMGGAVATELKFAPQATQFVVQFFHAVQ